MIRWFVIVNDEVLWYDTRKEAIVDHPKLIPKSFTFIPAKITDNPALLDKDPEYIGNLQAQDEVERARLLDGNWKVKKSEAILFNRRLIDLFATGQWKKPKRSRRYVVGIDPNFGAMGGDFFVVQVWDFSEFPRSLVFEYRDNSSTMSASIVRAIEIVCHYDPMAVGVEVNAGGRIVAERIVAQCPWVEVKEIVTTETSKRVHCDRIALALESGHVVYPEDWVGSSEMRQYSKHNLEAISGHDDTISAWFVAFAAASGQSESSSLLLGT